MRAIEVTHDFEHAADIITLDETDRHRRRISMRSEGGIEFLLDLMDAQLLRDGDGLLLEDGRVIMVKAAPEPLYEIRGDNPQHLLQLAWQLGNRHLPAQIFPDFIRIRQDRVIKEMIVGLGGKVDDIEAGFDPEGGAYGSSKPKPHSHDDAYGHHHEH